MIDKNCEGCYAYIQAKEDDNLKGLVCDLISSYKNKICPCSICIIKVICDTCCKEVEEYINHIRGYHYV